MYTALTNYLLIYTTVDFDFECINTVDHCEQTKTIFTSFCYMKAKHRLYSATRSFKSNE